MSLPSWRTGAGLAVVCLSAAWLSTAAALVFWTYLPTALGWQPRVVLSGSMAPPLQPGDVVLVERVAVPAAVPPGRVIMVDAPDLLAGSYVHRLIRHDADGDLVTRGDANASEDYPPVTPDRVLGQVRLVVPAVGRPVLWLRTGRVVPLLGVLAATGAAATVLAHPRRGRPIRWTGPG